MTWRCKATFLLYHLIVARASNNIRDVTEPTSPQDISCYKLKCFGGNCKNDLQVIDQNFQPAIKTIYFIESSCNGGFNSRAACSVESAAKANPNWHVIILFVGPLKTTFVKSKIYAKLSAKPNISFYRLNVTTIAEGTLLEGRFFNYLRKSSYRVVHSSDLLRLLVLRRYGGVYLDLDMIVLRSFDALPRNFIARERWDSVAAGVFGLGRDEVGRNFADMSIRDLSTSYNPYSWASSTRGLYTRTLNRICHADSIDQMDGKRCQGFNVFQENLFYPIHWYYWTVYYKADIQMPIENETYTHHLWNSFGSQVEVHINSFYSKLAKRYCPKILYLFKNKFGQ